MIGVVVMLLHAGRVLAEEMCALGGSNSANHTMFDSVECTADGSAWRTASVRLLFCFV